jgi:hypothetical protein
MGWNDKAISAVLRGRRFHSSHAHKMEEMILQHIASHASFVVIAGA